MTVWHDPITRRVFSGWEDGEFVREVCGPLHCKSAIRRGEPQKRHPGRQIPIPPGPTIRTRILEALAKGPLTSDQLSDITGIHVKSVRPKLWALEDSGRIVVVGVKNNSKVYRRVA